MNNKDDWKLKKIEIEFQTYGKQKGKYCGTIEFQNGEYESFRFNVKPDMAQRYIHLISQDVVDAAECLGDRLIKSLGLSD